MIPKVIHFCWLSGDPYPDSVQCCIDSWKRVLPDYELILWDTNRFDMSSSEWVRQAFEAKKYAFAADYIRMYALYRYGGIYLDSDVEVLKPFDDLLGLPYFIGKEKTPAGVEAATIGSEKGWPVAKLMLDRYDKKSFRGENGHLDVTPLPYLLRCCIESNFNYNSIKEVSQFNFEPSVINVFPVDYFSPKKWSDGTITVTSDTYSIHHFASSWMSGNTARNDGRGSFKEKISLFYRKVESRKYRDIALISNRPLSRDYYSYFLQKPCTPLLNTRVFGDDFLRLIALFESKRDVGLKFIPHDNTKHISAKYDFYPVGVVEGTDIEVHFIHSLTQEQARKEWEAGLDNVKGKRLVVAYVVLNEEDEHYYSQVNLPKFKITARDKGLEDLNQENCDSYFWKKHTIMKVLRKKIRQALNNK